MSAQPAGHGVPVNSFSAHLALAAGVTVSIHAPSMHALRNVVAVLQPSEPANDALSVAQATALVDAAKGNAATPAVATVPAGSPATPTTAPSAQAAAAAVAGEAGNANAAAPQGGTSAQSASSDKPSASPEVTFDVLKKAFLALSTKAGGRTLCEGVLKPFNLGKLSEAKPEQYAAVLAEIQKASA